MRTGAAIGYKSETSYGLVPSIVIRHSNLTWLIKADNRRQISCPVHGDDSTGRRPRLDLETICRSSAEATDLENKTTKPTARSGIDHSPFDTPAEKETRSVGFLFHTTGTHD